MSPRIASSGTTTEAGTTGAPGRVTGYVPLCATAGLTLAGEGASLGASRGGRVSFGAAVMRASYAMLTPTRSGAGRPQRPPRLPFGRTRRACHASCVVRLLSSALFWRILLSFVAVVGVLGYGLFRATSESKDMKARSNRLVKHD